MITFIGRPMGGHIYVDVLNSMGNGDDRRISIEPLQLTLDEWQHLLRESARDGDLDEDDHFIWVCTPVEYESSTGEEAPVSVLV